MPMSIISCVVDQLNTFRTQLYKSLARKRHPIPIRSKTIPVTIQAKKRSWHDKLGNSHICEIMGRPQVPVPSNSLTAREICMSCGTAQLCCA